jgi:hypothetical protein
VRHRANGRLLRDRRGDGAQARHCDANGSVKIPPKNFLDNRTACREYALVVNRWAL